MRQTTRPLLIRTAVAVLLSSIVACGDGSGSIRLSDAPSTTAAGAVGSKVGDPPPPADDNLPDVDPEDADAFVAYINGDDALVDADQGACAAASAVGQLSEGAMGTIRTGGDFDLTSFGTADVAVIVEALDTCVPLDSAVAAFAEGVAGTDGLPITVAEATCASTEFASEFGGAGQFIEAVSTMTEDESGSRLLTALGGCITDEGAASFMTNILAGQGMDQETANCVATSLVDILGKEELMAAIVDAGSNGSSAELETATTSSATACAVVSNG